MVDSRNEELSPVKRALLELRDLRAQLDTLQDRQHEPIAIIGAGLRFPGGVIDLETYWDMLSAGRDAITEVPASRWDIDAYYDPDPQIPGRMSTRYGGFIDHVDQFDPQFFGISPREAVSMDPQQRLLLEVTWEALEHAGQSPDQLFGSPTGVFVGISHSDYLHMIFDDINKIDVYSTTGSALSIAGGRIAYVLGIQGPSMSIDTACSSSLVAIHQAVQSLRLGESDLAVAGGVGLILSPEITINFSKSQMMAADGRCKTFDATADGYVRGEGCAMVVLKRLRDAEADGDHILAVIRGSAINQDGRSGGLTAPNGPSQESVIAAALANARVDPADVTYVEAHGTGTSLGDPIEVQALGAVLGRAHSATNPLMIGSVKTNFGHLEAAAGIAGLLKVVLALQHREIPPHLHFSEPNPFIPWDQYPITVPTARTPWSPPGDRWLAGVSSFGFSGTNAHIILEAAPPVAATQPAAENNRHVLPLSARTPAALNALAERYRAYFATRPDASFAHICYTAAAGRAHFEQRLALVAGSAEEAHDLLAAYADGELAQGVFAGTAQDQPEIAFLFTGHGSQYLHMGRELYDTEPVFRDVIDQCAELLEPYLEQSLLTALFPTEGQPSLLDGMIYTQPALFAIQIALAELWRSWGITPDIVMGHSVGEYAAACIAGVFSLADGIKLVAARGRLMEELPEAGQMVAVFADEVTVAGVIAPYTDRVSIAVLNGPTNTVISGAAEPVEAIIAALKAAGIKSRRLAVAQASHSPLLDPMLDEFEQIAATITYHEPQITLVSCTTGQVVAPGEVTNAAYWRRHIRQMVRFTTALETIYEQGLRVYLEIGPHPTLLGLAQRCLPDSDASWLPSLREGVGDRVQMLETVGSLYIAGLAPHWPALFDVADRRRLPLPTYPFQRASYWADVARPVAIPAAPAWDAVTGAAQHAAQHGPLDLALHTYPQRWDALDRLTTAHILRTFAELGAFQQAGDRYSADTLIDQFGIQPIYRNLMRRWLGKLAALGWLAEEDGQFTNPAALPAPDMDAAWAEVDTVMSDLPAVRDYFRRCGAYLTPIITGRESALTTMFPGGTFEQAEELYQHWSLSRYFAGITRAGLEAVVRTLPANKVLRVLEIGAGTGATTSALLPVLPPNRAEYLFTDVSDMFLAHAADKFQQYPFMRYAVLDIEQNPVEQGYGAHSFDVIVATNVLHATRDINQTVAHVESLLVPGGVLLLNETTEHLPWYDMTTGLIGGWQRFADDLRTDNPLLTPQQWREVLLDHGFVAVQATPEAGSAPEILGQHVIVACTAQTGNIVSDSHTLIGTTAADHQADQPVASTPDFIQQLQDTLPDERHEMLVDFVRQRVIRVLRLDAGQKLDPNQRLLDLGLDSLMALELRTMLSGGLGLGEALPATLVFDYPTMTAVAAYLAETLGLDEEAPDEVTTEQPGQTERAAEIEDLSDDEVAALLMKKFRH